MGCAILEPPLWSLHHEAPPALRELLLAHYMLPAANATGPCRGHEAARLGCPFVASASAVDALEVLRLVKMWVCRDAWRHALVAVFFKRLAPDAPSMSDDDARLCGWAASVPGLTIEEVRPLLDLALDEPPEFEAPPRLHRSREDRV